MTRSRASSPKIRPLVARPGARFTCTGDGTCCTDIHAVGPIGRKDRALLSLIDPDVCLHEPGGDYVLGTKEDGTCVFLGDGVCELHAALGPQIKARACRRFPYELTKTPRGGRVVTEHRCPCRTMGERPELSLEDAEGALSDRAGRVSASWEVARVPLARGRSVTFERWERIEAGLFARLTALDDPADIFDVHGLPELDGLEWRAVGERMRALSNDTRAEVAFQFLGDAIFAELGLRSRPHSRPWSDTFDRAEARAQERDPRELYADWLQDEIWALRWTMAGGFARARRDLGTRYHLARRIARRIRRAGTRPDRAAAEAIMIVDIARETDFWEPVVAAMSDESHGDGSK